MTISERVTVSGTVNLILCDGKTLTCEKGINVSERNTLNIFAQSTGNNMGKLTANTGNNDAAIGGRNNQSGGKITISGGNVTATTKNNVAGIGGGSGGAGGTITINGGTVEASSSGNGAAIGGGFIGEPGTITLAWTKSNDSIKVNKYNGTVKIRSTFTIGYL